MAKTDTLLAHCIARTLIADAGGREAAEAKYVKGRPVPKWQQFKAAAKATPRASRVAAFIALWGLALYDLDRDELTVDEYAEWANESRATSFRRLAQYREVWGEEHEDVNELARLVRDYVKQHTEARRNANALTSIAVAI